MDVYAILSHKLRGIEISVGNNEKKFFPSPKRQLNMDSTLFYSNNSYM